MPLVISDIGIHDSPGTHGGEKTRRNRIRRRKVKRTRKHFSRRKIRK